MGNGHVLIRGLLLCLAGFLLLRLSIRAAQRLALLTGAFWLTFPEYARYRLKRLWPLAPGLAGLILLIWGLIFLFRWLLAYYAARLGHPLG
jgi:uncharacterized membrane protein HdeD (DUF308 family)